MTETQKPEAAWTKAGLLAVVKKILGPHGRVWEREGAVQIGVARGAGKLILASGPNYYAAFDNAFLKPMAAREKARQEHLESLKAGVQPTAAPPEPVEGPAGSLDSSCTES